MTRITLDITMSLDGFVAGPEPSLDDPLGKRGMELHEWVFGLASWRRAHGGEGGETGPDSDLVAEHVASYGAVVMGRRMYSGGEGPWADDPNAGGWWGDDPPFHVPVFVLTHHPRESSRCRAARPSTLSPRGSTSPSTGRRRRRAAGTSTSPEAPAQLSKRSPQGASTSSRIHVAPVLLGSGTRLFENLDGSGVKLEPLPVPASPAVTHLRYRVVR